MSAATWLKPLAERGRRRTIVVDLEDSRFDPVFQYAVTVGHDDNPVQDAIRDLLLQATSDSAALATVAAAHRRAYRDESNKVRTEIMHAIREVAVRLGFEAPTELSAAPENTFVEVEP